MKKVCSIFLLFVAFFAGCSKSELTWDEYKQNFKEELIEDAVKNNVTGASYSVFNKDSIIWKSSIGYSDKEKNISANDNTLYIIGSVTKVFTATAILQLYEKKLLDIDKPVSDYIEDFKIKQRFPSSKPIIIREILTHHAGLPSDIFYKKFSENPPHYRELLHYFNSHYTTFPVGKIKSYSNIGYALLGIIIEKVSKKSYNDYIVCNIFNPLQMNNSGFYSSPTLQDSIAKAYAADGSKKRELPIYDSPAGAIYSNIQDMVKFGKAFLMPESPILKKGTVNLMFELQNKEVVLDLYAKSAICFNFRNKAEELGRVFEHGGATMYHRAQLFIAPDARLGAVILSNSPKGVDNSWKVNEMLMCEYAKRSNLKIDRNIIPKKTFEFTSIQKKDLKSFCGTYAMPGMTSTLKWQDNNILVNIRDNDFFLIPSDDHAFTATKKFLGFPFKSNKFFFFLEEINGEKVFIQAMPWGDLSIIGKKVEPKPISETWKQRLGKYSVINLAANDYQMINNIELIERNGFLILRFKYNTIANSQEYIEMALNIATENEAFTEGFGAGGGESVIFSNNEDRFEFYGLICKRNSK